MDHHGRQAVPGEQAGQARPGLAGVVEAQFGRVAQALLRGLLGPELTRPAGLFADPDDLGGARRR
ncbi:hypothetical protein Kpho01_37980 [Kitasatospora phosalacinea]|uniref:Uncharacterized protein n=1 Tax=Kitasatospora phosalacinea TaxID=2065 RepID=A0A9W6PJ51_9ACTN|nr:hypothetical protein Kpho01_37980 [Kitasatospora phosalacinea]